MENDTESMFNEAVFAIIVSHMEKSLFILASMTSIYTWRMRRDDEALITLNEFNGVGHVKLTV